MKRNKKWEKPHKFFTNPVFPSTRDDDDVDDDDHDHDDDDVDHDDYDIQHPLLVQ